MDTSGDQQFPAMRRLSIATAHAFMLVYAATSESSFLSVKKCFEEIREQRSDYQVSFCCVVLIQMNAPVCTLNRLSSIAQRMLVHTKTNKQKKQSTILNNKNKMQHGFRFDITRKYQLSLHQIRATWQKLIEKCRLKMLLNGYFVNCQN